MLTFKPHQSADLVCHSFPKVDSGDVNIHMVSLGGQLLHAATCDPHFGVFFGCFFFSSLGIKGGACLEVRGCDYTQPRRLKCCTP